MDSSLTFSQETIAEVPSVFRKTDADEHLSLARLGCRHILVAQDVARSVLVKADGLHGTAASVERERVGGAHP